MVFDPTRPSSDRNRARPLTAAEAVIQANAKSRITASLAAGKIGLALALVGTLGLTRVMERRRLNSVALPDIRVTLPDGHPTMLTFGQVASLCVVPIGLALAIVGFYLNRRYTKEAMADPATAGIFDPSVEWSEKP